MTPYKYLKICSKVACDSFLETTIQHSPNFSLNFETFSAVLEEHRKQCEMEGKYVEAEMAKNRIEELKI